jgi:hypothetical protein
MRTQRSARTLPLWLGLGALLLLGPLSEAWATTAAGICASVNASCTVPGEVTITGLIPITDGSVLDFRGGATPGAVNRPKVIIAQGGALVLGGTNVPTLGGCPNASPTMTILAGDLTIQSGGTINGDSGIIGSAMTNGGAIFIQLEATSIPLVTSGNLVIEPGGDLSSDRLGQAGNGRGGNLTVLAEGQIWVMANPGAAPGNTADRGIISSNTQAASRPVFTQGCGLSEVTLVATGRGATANEAIRIDGTVEIVFPPPSVEPVVGGIINLSGGGDFSLAGNTTIQNVPPFPSIGAITPPNPPENGPKVVVGGTGIINTDGKDPGGGIVRIFACYFLIEGANVAPQNGPGGLVQVGGNATTGTNQGREQFLPAIVLVMINELIEIQDGGQIKADLREGFKLHVGQKPLCDFTPVVPPNANGPVSNLASNRGGADVCLIAGGTSGATVAPFTTTGISVNSTALGPQAHFAVSARTVVGNQTGGTIVALLTTREGDIDLADNALNASGNARGGMIQIQSTDNVNITGIVQANGPVAGGTVGVEAVGTTAGPGTGEITAAVGTVSATPTGTITFRECTVNPANNPASIPAAVLLPASCGVPMLIPEPPTLAPCAAPCFCLSGFRLRSSGQILQIMGEALQLVTRVDVNSPNCNPANGTSVPFTLDAQGRIIVNNPPALVSNTHIVLSNLPTGPSSSCSNPIP